MSMNFEKLLTNCQNRIEGESETIKFDISNGRFVLNNGIRPGIGNIIEEKMKTQKENEAVVNEKSENSPGILFSLRDFIHNKTQKEEEVVEEEDNAEPEEAEEEPEEEMDVEDFVDEELLAKEASDSEYDLGEEEEEQEDNKAQIHSEDESDLEVMDTEANSDSDVEEIKPTGKKSSEGENLEADLNDLENAKQKLEDNLKNHNDLSEKTENVGNPESAKEFQFVNVNVNEGQSNRTENLIRDQTETPANENTEAPKKDEISLKTKEPKIVDLKGGKNSLFKNISISVVGSGSKPTNFDSTSTSKSASDGTKSDKTSKPASSKTTAGSNLFSAAGINVSLFKRKTDVKPTNSSQNQGPVPVITIGEKVKAKPEITEDEEVEEDTSAENLAYKYDNCPHGDPLDYLCVDCVVNRWKAARDFANPKPKPKPVPKPVVEETVKIDLTAEPDLPSPVDPAKLLNTVNWAKVFSFAGITAAPSNEGTKSM